MIARFQQLPTMHKFSPALDSAYCARAGYIVAQAYEEIVTVERYQVAPAIKMQDAGTPRHGLRFAPIDAQLQPTGT